MRKPTPLLFAAKPFIGLLLLIACCLWGCKHERNATGNKALNSIKEEDRPDSLLSQASVYLFRPGAIKSDMDSALYFTNQALTLSQSLHKPIAEGKCYTVFAGIYRDKGDMHKGKEYVQKAVAILSKYKVTEALGDAYTELGQYCDPSNREGYEESTIILQKAAKCYEQVGEKLKQANTLTVIGDVHQMLGNNSLAMTELKQALVLYQTVYYPQLQNVYDLLGVGSTIAGDYQEGLKYGLLAVKTGESLHDSTWRMQTAYNRLGLVYFRLKQYNNALNSMQNSVSVAMKNHDTTAVIVVSMNMVNSLLGLDSTDKALALLKDVSNKYYKAEVDISTMCTFVKVYLARKEFPLALPYVKKALDVIEHIAPGKSEPGYPDLHATVIKYYLATHQYTEANKYSAAFARYSKQYANVKFVSVSYFYQFKIDSALGKYTSAIVNYEKYNEMNDSMMNEDKAKQIAILQVQYETDKKEQNILVLTKQGQLQQTQIRQTQLIRNVIIGGAIMLLLLLGIISYAYRVKQRSNMQLQEQQMVINQKNVSLQQLVTEKEWLVKEIHHRVKNNLQIVISLLNAQSDFLDNQSALKAINESRERMFAIALIHEKLYQLDQGMLIGMKSYIQEMITHLGDSVADLRKISFQVHVDDINLDVSQSVPLGLIINEAITNSIKYAFNDGRQGLIEIVLKRINADDILLKVTDNGKGLPADFDFETNNSLGIQLIKLFAEQLEGSLNFESKSGVGVSLTFKQYHTDNSDSTFFHAI